MKSKNTFSGPWDRGNSVKSPDPDEIMSRKLLINLVRGVWSDALQDQVFLRDEPTAEMALELVERYGVRRAERIILKMNE